MWQTGEYSNQVPTKKYQFIDYVSGGDRNNEDGENDKKREKDESWEYLRDQGKIIDDQRDQVYRLRSDYIPPVSGNDNLMTGRSDSGTNRPTNKRSSQNMPGSNTSTAASYKRFDFREFDEKPDPNYDPYLGYVHKRGLIGRTDDQYVVKRIAVDSRERIKETKTQISRTIDLETDPVKIVGNLIYFTLGNTDGFEANDKIAIDGVQEKTIVLRNQILDSTGQQVNILVFEEGKNYLKILSPNNTDINQYFLLENLYRYDDLYVTLDGITGDMQQVTTFKIPQSMTVSFTPTTLVNPPESSIGPYYQFYIYEDLNFRPFNGGVYPPDGSYPPVYMTIADAILDSTGSVIQTTPLGNLPYLIPTTPPYGWWNLAGTSFQLFNAGNFYYTQTRSTILSNVTQLPIPATFVEYMAFVQEVQNISRAAYPAFYSNFLPSNPDFERTIDFSPITSQYQTSNIGMNIPTNYLNDTHRMYFTKDQILLETDENTILTEDPANDKFYIKLNSEYHANQFGYSYDNVNQTLTFTSYMLSVSDITISFLHYGGIPLNRINSDYPIGFTRIDGYRYIDSVSSGSIVDECSANYIAQSYIAQSSKNIAQIIIRADRDGFYNSNFGGNSVTIGLISDILSAYSNINEYKLELKSTLTNIMTIKMINSAFPKSHYPFDNGLYTGVVNNKLYWENLYDQSTVYSLEIDPGFYSETELKQEIENKASQIYRENQGTSYRTNKLIVRIDQKSDSVSFQSWDSYRKQPTTEIFTMAESLSVLIGTDSYYAFGSTFFQTFPQYLSIYGSTYIMTVQQTPHFFVIGDLVTIENSLDVGVIPASLVNGVHTVVRIRDINNYDIAVSGVNPLSSATIMGGNNVVVLWPQQFRMRFDKSDTMGVQLGFRDVGKETSITPYATTITNGMRYANETVTSASYPNAAGSINFDTVSIHDSVRLDGPEYLLITCDEIVNANTLLFLPDFFYKINLPSEPHKYSFDTYFDGPIYFTEPVRKIDTLTFKFYTPDGKPYAFNGWHFSFCLEFLVYDEIPRGTLIRKK